MNTALWIMQIVVALVMFFAGAFKLVTPREKLAAQLKWPATWTDTNVKLLGLAEILGAVGLIAPWRLAIAPVLTPIAAIALAVLMGGAVKTHLDLKESPAPAVVLAVLCVVIALGRFGVL